MLERVPMFSDIDAKLIETLEAGSQHRVFQKNTVVISEGDETDNLFILLSGRAHAIRTDESGRQLVVNRFSTFDCFGEISFLNGGLRSATVVTKERCELMIIPRSCFLSLASDHPEIYWNFITYLLSKLRYATQQIEDLAFRDVYGRLAHFLTENQDEKGVVPEKLTQQEMADIVGASRETVARILSTLQEGGFVSRQKGRTIILKKLPYKF